MSPRKGGLGRMPDRKQSCRKKVISDTSCTKKKQDISRQSGGISIYTDLTSNKDDWFIHPPLYDNRESTVFVIFDINQIEYPPLYD